MEYSGHLIDLRGNINTMDLRRTNQVPVVTVTDALHQLKSEWDPGFTSVVHSALLHSFQNATAEGGHCLCCKQLAPNERQQAISHQGPY